VGTLKDTFTNASARAAGTALRTAGTLLDRALDRQVRLAVTGLSQSGKTAFITALVNQLEHACTPDAKLPLWKVQMTGRLLGARRVPQQNAHIPRFGYEAATERLFADPPGWPESTRGVSEIRLELRYRPTGRLARERGTLYLDIVDYPGEWLLDLPLLRQSYEDWSVQVAATLKASPRAAALAEPWTRWAPRPDDPFSEQAAAAAAQAYTAWLHACRAELGLSLLQPGRFLLPGEYAGAPLLQFVPWIWQLPRDKAAEGSTFATLAHRYEQYKQHIVKGFYQRHFSGFDRQIVLVDCLHALDAGPECFRDTERALARIIESFDYGKGNLLRRLFSPRIDRLLFVASKADHVLPEQHPNLLSLLQHMIKGSHAVARFEGVTSECMALASVAATGIARGKGPGGESMSGLRGHALDGTPLLVRPPAVPAAPPGEAWWSERTDRFDRFRPPRMDPARPMPHIRLDGALEFLLGDKLR
jgi:hypothetical protein